MNSRLAVPLFVLMASLALTAAGRAQRGPQPPPPPPPRQQGQRPGPPPERRGGGQPGNALRMPAGRWWDNHALAESLGLSPEQVQKMDSIFGGVRDHLIDLDASVRKAEGDLQPLLAAEPVERAAAAAQIERLTRARAALDLANEDMLLDIRLQLTREQWSQLANLRPPRPQEE